MPRKLKLKKPEELNIHPRALSPNFSHFGFELLERRPGVTVHEAVKKEPYPS